MIRAAIVCALFAATLTLIYLTREDPSSPLVPEVVLRAHGTTPNALHEMGMLRAKLMAESASRALEVDWEGPVSDFMQPYAARGIDAALFNASARNEKYGRRSMLVVVQYVGGALLLVDPMDHCTCSRTGYPGLDWAFLGRRCRAFLDILDDALSTDVSIPDFELILNVEDFPGHARFPFTSPTNASLLPPPIFSVLRCWPKGGFAVPMPGSHSNFLLDAIDPNLDRYALNTVPLQQRESLAVFRGGLDRGCSEERDVFMLTTANRPLINKSTCGRGLLKSIASAHPDLINLNATRISLLEQSRAFRYVLNVEGWGGWADRLEELLATHMAVFVQETQCDQWFEPLLKPFVHFVPFAHDLRNLPGRVRWANAHPALVQRIVNESVAFSRRYLRRDGLRAYLRVLLRAYARQLTYKVQPRTGGLTMVYLRANGVGSMPLCSAPERFYKNYLLGASLFS